MRASRYLLLVDRRRLADWRSLDAAPGDGSGGTYGWRALAAHLGIDGAAFASALVAGLDTCEGEAPVTRLVVPSSAGPSIVAVTELPAASFGPGAPTLFERVREAGLRLGAELPGGTVWWDEDDVAQHAGDEDDGAARSRDALWLGVCLGAQRPGRSASVEPESLDEPRFADGAAPSARMRTQAAATAWVRELSERPANLLGPKQFADEIAAFVARVGRGVECEVWSEDDARARGFGGLCAVGSGAARQPLVVRLRWGGAEGAALGLVGKGITFDTGGINVKRDAGELAWMKSDMAAAAAVAAALVCASAEGPAGRPVEAILPLTDNAVSGSAMRPGDVITHPGGRTTEIVDTDCEGRLVLADGLGWLREAGAAVLIDVGTLTDGGAGLRRTGLWSNDAALAVSLGALAESAGDPLWALPLPCGEEGELHSRVADARNAPSDAPDVGRHAAMFLAAFAGETPWAHFDIGGTAYLEAPIAGWPEGPTGAATAALAAAVLAWRDGTLR